MKVEYRVTTKTTINATHKIAIDAITEIQETGDFKQYGELLNAYRQLREEKVRGLLTEEREKELSRISKIMSETFEEDLQAVLIAWHHREIPDRQYSSKHEELF